MAAGSSAAANPLRPLLTVPEVAELLRLSPRSVRRLIADGRLPVVRLGHAIRIRPQDVEALVASSGQERARND
jgi:excisionase family DNA binding protein